MVRNEDLLNDRHKRAFLLTPREKFVLQQNLGRAYDHAFLDIGFGVTISGPHIVGRMTSNIDPKQGEKVLEIGTGSGYQSAYLSHLTDKVYTIEIIKPLAERTRGIYDGLDQGRLQRVRRRSRPRPPTAITAGRRSRPFDKIIVTCGIDHVPPPLLQQLKPGGIMVIPVGPPGAQRVLKVVKTEAPDGQMTVARSDIYGGRDRALRAVHQARRRPDRRHAQQLTDLSRPSFAALPTLTERRSSLPTPCPARTS